MFPPCSGKPLLFGRIMSIIALGVSLYVHYIAFSMVAANSRSTGTALQTCYNRHYKLVTNPVTTNSLTTQALHKSMAPPLQTRYNPVTTNAQTKGTSNCELATTQSLRIRSTSTALQTATTRSLHYEFVPKHCTTNSLQPGHYEFTTSPLQLQTRYNHVTMNLLQALCTTNSLQPSHYKFATNSLQLLYNFSTIPLQPHYNLATSLFMHGLVSLGGF